MAPATHVASSSHCYEPFKSIGHVSSTGVAQITVGATIEQHRMYTVLENSFQCFEATMGRLIFAGPQFTSPISCIFVERIEDTSERSMKLNVAGCSGDDGSGFTLGDDGAQASAGATKTTTTTASAQGQQYAIQDLVYVALNDSASGNALATGNGTRGNCIYVLNQREVVAMLVDDAKQRSVGPSDTIIQMFKIGPYLFSFTKHSCTIWDRVQLDKQQAGSSQVVRVGPLRTFKLAQGSTLTCVLHLETYLDKILVGTEEGHIDLYNVRAGKLIHRFGPFAQETDGTDGDIKNLRSLFAKDSSNDGEDAAEKKSRNAYVTVMEPSGVLDLVAVGLSDGQILLLNTKLDKVLFSFRHSPGPVTSLSFRKDGQFATLVSGNDSGEVAVWSLETRQLLTKWSPHAKAVRSLFFFPDEANLLTCGADNQLQIVTFHSDVHQIRKFYISGHYAPPRRLRFYDPLGTWILTSGGADRQVRLTAITNDGSNGRASHEVSQMKTQDLKKLRKRTGAGEELTRDKAQLPPMTDFDCCFIKNDEQWETMVSSHANSGVVRLWNLKNRIVSKQTLKTQQPGSVGCVAMSMCGNFAFIGGTQHIEKWNVQSKKLKQTWTPESATQGFVGLIVDNGNTRVVSGEVDGRVCFWNLVDGKLLETHVLGSPITRMAKSSDSSNLVAVACDDLNIRVFDMNTMKLIRVLKNARSNQQHQLGLINDLQFSHDSRSLVCCDSAGNIMTYDIISANRVDWMKVDDPAMSVAFHPLGLYIATVHAQSLGINIWINKIRFGGTILQNVTEPILVNKPSSGEIVIDAEIGDEKAALAALRARAKQLLESVPSALDDSDESSSESDSDSDSDSSDDDSDSSSDSDDEDEPAAKRRRGDADATGIEEPLPELISLSGLPKHRWHSITNLDVIRKRSKPRSQRKKLIAPFLLTTQSTTKGPVFVKNAQEKTEEDVDGAEGQAGLTDAETATSFSRILKLDVLGGMLETPSSSVFVDMLKQDMRDKTKYKQTMEYLKHPSTTSKTIDVSIRSLSAANRYEEMKLVLQFFIYHLEQGHRQDYDLVQAMLNLFVRVHQEVMSHADREAFQLMQRLSQLQQETWQRLDELFQTDMFFAKYLNHMQ